MVRAKTYIGLVVAALVLLGTVGQASAVSVWNSNVVGQNATVGGSLSIAGLTINAVDCTAKVGGTNVSSANGGCGLLNLQMTATASRGYVTVTITGASSGPIFSSATSITGAAGTVYKESAGVNDLTLWLNVSTSTKSISTVGATLTGSTTGTGTNGTTDLSDVTLGESLVGGVKKTGTGTETGTLNNTGGTAGISLSSLATGAYSGTVSGNFACTANCASGTTFAPMTSYQLQKDIKLAQVTSGDTVQLRSITEVFYTPEPATTGLMIVGIGGLIAARQVRRKRG